MHLAPQEPRVCVLMRGDGLDMVTEEGKLPQVALELSTKLGMKANVVTCSQLPESTHTQSIGRVDRPLPV